MVEPVIFWDADLLRQIGFVISITGVTVLVTHPLGDIGMTGRSRFLIAISIAGSTLYGMTQYPRLTDVVVLLSGALAFVVPFAICLRAFQLIIHR